MQKYYFFLKYASTICINAKKAVILPTKYDWSTMTNKELYSRFCSLTLDLPIFMQGWWMDAVCAGKQWDVLLCVKVGNEYRLLKNEDGEYEIVAVMPYLSRKRAWARYVVMPQMTQIGGIWLREDIRSDVDAQHSICRCFKQQLDAMQLSYYYQHFPLNSSLPVYMADMGFKLKRRVTYRIEDLSDLDAVISRFSKNKKRQLQKALSLHVDYNMHIEDFYRFHMDCLREQGKDISYTREFLLVMERKTSRLNQSQVISICNADNQVLAAAFLVWDNHSMYYLIPCYRMQYKDSGASALLVLEAIKLARQKGVAFDFEGSMIKGVASHYKQFGSTPVPYYSVEKYYHWWFWFAIAYNRLRERKMR